MSTATEQLSPEDIALFRADPDYAESLGIRVRCRECGGRIREIWGPWDGSPLVHAVLCPPSEPKHSTEESEP